MRYRLSERIEIHIPAPIAEAILLAAAETELSVEEILEAAIKNYLEGEVDHGRG